MVRKKTSKTEYVAFRASKEVLEKIKIFAKNNNFSVGLLINISVLEYMGETDLMNQELQRKILR